jgi:hypothetical protein
MSDNKYHISVVSLILSLNLGSEEMAIEEYVQFTREEIGMQTCLLMNNAKMSNVARNNIFNE